MLRTGILISIILLFGGWILSDLFQIRNVSAVTYTKIKYLESIYDDEYINSLFAKFPLEFGRESYKEMYGKILELEPVKIKFRDSFDLDYFIDERDREYFTEGISSIPDLKKHQNRDEFIKLKNKLIYSKLIGYGNPRTNGIIECMSRDFLIKDMFDNVSLGIDHCHEPDISTTVNGYKITRALTQYRYRSKIVLTIPKADSLKIVSTFRRHKHRSSTYKVFGKTYSEVLDISPFIYK